MGPPFGEMVPGGTKFPMWLALIYLGHFLSQQGHRGSSPSTHYFLHAEGQGETGEVMVILSNLLKNGVYFASAGRHP